MISMRTYEKLKEEVKSGKEIRRDVIQKDIKKRKVKRVVMAVFVCLGIVALAVLMVLASQGILPSMGMSPYVEALYEWFIGVTWLLCWVGFPIGWGLNRKERQDAKSQVSVTYVVDEYGNVERRASTLPARIAAFFISLFMGCITMMGSFVIAIVQIFTIQKDIKFIQSILDIDKQSN